MAGKKTTKAIRVPGYAYVAKMLEARGVNVEKVKAALKAQRIETPSWGYAKSGTRFGIFNQPGEARDVYEKLADAAMVHKLTGVAPTVALHIPWDMTDDWKGLRRYARKLGVDIGAINPNVFQDQDYKLGSTTNPKARIRRKATRHMLDCVEIMKATGSKVLSLWFADGTNYPGQGHFRARKRWMMAALQEVYKALPGGARMLIEYKFFEPGFYHTDIPDYGTALDMSKQLGPKAQVLVDLGHHPLGANIEQIVAYLIDEGKLGGFHFNSKKYADDDLTVGSINPYELFLIFNEIIDGERDRSVKKLDIAYMIDQSHNIKPKIEAMIQSVDTIQETYAKALTIDRKALAAAQKSGDTVAAEECLKAACNTDVRPIITAARKEMGLEPDVIRAYRESGYAERIAGERA